MIVEIPYGRGIQILDTGDAAVELLIPKIHESKPERPEIEIVEAALSAPIGSPPLEELAKGKGRAVVICSDHTRPVPTRAILPPMLAALRRGNPEIDVTLLVATGLHRATTVRELADKFGPEIAARERIVVHDCTDEENLVDLGGLPSGARLTVNRLAVECDLLVAEGFIEPHFFAGYSGGRKSVLPGICGRETVLANHCADFIANPMARTGILEGNPIQRDMLEAVKLAGLKFIVNAVINGEKEAVAAFAGDPVKAHEAGTRYLDSLCRVWAAKPAGIAVTSNGGAPLDQNIYQAVKGMTAAEAVLAPGGAVIIAAECSDGSGGDDFHRMLRDCLSPEELLGRIERTPMEKTEPDQWQVQILARVLREFRVILVCDEAHRGIAREMKLETADSVQAAFDMAVAERPDAHVAVIPDGVSVIAGVGGA